jgi:hypothetical protein
MPNVLTAAQITELVARYWTPLTIDQFTDIVAVSLGESDGDASALYINPNTGDKSYGLFQINMIGNLMQERLKEFGLTAPEQLFDPATNVRCAFKIYQSQGIHAWGAYTDGGYKKYGRYENAQAAVEAFLAHTQYRDPLLRRIIAWIRAAGFRIINRGK